MIWGMGHLCENALVKITCIRRICEFRTDPAGEHLLVVDIALHPAHQVFNVGRRGHLSWSFVMFRILP